MWIKNEGGLCKHNQANKGDNHTNEALQAQWLVHYCPAATSSNTKSTDIDFHRW